MLKARYTKVLDGRKMAVAKAVVILLRHRRTATLSAFWLRT